MHSSRAHGVTSGGIFVPVWYVYVYIFVHVQVYVYVFMCIFVNEDICLISGIVAEYVRQITLKRWEVYLESWRQRL